MPTEDRDADGCVKFFAIILLSNKSLIAALKIHKNKYKIRNKNMKISIFKLYETNNDLFVMITTLAMKLPQE